MWASLSSPIKQEVKCNNCTFVLALNFYEYTSHVFHIYMIYIPPKNKKNLRSPINIYNASKCYGITLCLILAVLDSVTMTNYRILIKDYFPCSFQLHYLPFSKSSTEFFSEFRKIYTFSFPIDFIF